MSFSSDFKFGTLIFAGEVEKCDHWNRYKEDIQLMKESGLTACSLSIDWEKVEPSLGYFDQQALQHYADACDEFNYNNIEPVIILKDYRDPAWFINCGGFEKDYNIQYFEEYCSKVFEALQGKAYKFITFWSPESYAMLGYWNKTHYPFKKNMQLAIDVLKNELEAHVRVYQNLKKADTENKIHVGITKHVVQLEPYYPWDKLACSMANKLTNDSFYTFFTTGKFDISIRTLPAKWGGVVKHYTNSLAPHSIDFIGINYHSHYQMKNFKRMSFAHEAKTDVKKVTVYPEGLYAAIKEVDTKMARQLNIPMIITQSGIATTNDNLRKLHDERYVYATHAAMQDGCNVQGFYYYSFLDGFSCGEYGKKFGLYSVDYGTMERTIKPGASRFVEIAKKHGESQ
ncbi:MAG TPA: family 1 glycosylhydrolase [Candidatus Babeliales bacterium]|nr:family 1 glycosylhydrolase [Candidatus Babeliales bacterium]